MFHHLCTYKRSVGNTETCPEGPDINRPNSASAYKSAWGKNLATIYCTFRFGI